MLRDTTLPKHEFRMQIVLYGQDMHDFNHEWRQCTFKMDACDIYISFLFAVSSLR